MDPFTMTAVAATALNVAGSVASGSAEVAQANSDAAIADVNAGRARLSAKNAYDVGAAAEAAKRRQIRQELGRSAAAMSQSGTGGPSQTTNALLAKQSASAAELDAQNIRYDAQMQGYGYETEAQNYDAEATAARRRARGAKFATALNVAGDIVGGYANYSGRKAQMPRPVPKPTRTVPGGSKGLVAY